MEVIFRICLLLSGLINFLPSVLAILPQRISESYGIVIQNQNYELLLRHRAVLFAIVGSIMMISAIKKTYYNLSVIIGLTSMLSFVILYYSVNGVVNSELTKVMQIDMFGIVILIIGLAMLKLKKG